MWQFLQALTVAASYKNIQELSCVRLQIQHFMTSLLLTSIILLPGLIQLG